MHIIQLAPTEPKHHRAVPLHQDRECRLGAVIARPNIPVQQLDVCQPYGRSLAEEGFHALENDPNLAAGHGWLP